MRPHIYGCKEPMIHALALLVLSGGGLVPPGTPPPPLGPNSHPGYLPYGPHNHGIEASISPQTTINTTEGAYYDELVTGSDTDEWVKQISVNGFERAYFGNAAAVSIVALGEPDEFDPDYKGPGGDIKGSGYVAVSDASVTIHYVRKAGQFQNVEYPVVCNDRYEVFDNQPGGGGGTVPFGWQLRDPQRPILVFSVHVHPRALSGGED